MTGDADAPVPSPCRKRCELHPIERRCLGCLRTIDEIARWARLSEADRRRIVDELPARRAAWKEQEAAIAARPPR